MIPKQRHAMNEVTNFRGEVVTEADTDAAAGEAFIALVGDRVRNSVTTVRRTRMTAPASAVSPI